MHFNLNNRVLTRLRIRHLELLDVLGEGISIHAAASRLSLTQPAITKMLQDIEEIYGAPLFERLPKGLRATLAGDAAIRWARFTLNGIGESFSEIKTLNEGATGFIRVGAQIVAIPTLLGNALVEVTRNYPDILVRVMEGAVQGLMQSLAANEVDLVISRLSPSALQAPFQFERLSDQARFSLVARKGHPLTTLTTVTVADLKDAKWLLPPEPAPIRQEIFLMFSDAGLSMSNPSIESSSYIVTELVLRDTDLICPLPLEVAHLLANKPDFVILPFEVPIFMPPIGMVWNPQLPHRPVLDTFKGILRRTAQITRFHGVMST